MFVSLAAVSEVKGRQRGGERKNGSGSARGGRIDGSQSVPQAEAQAQPWAVTSAGSCAGTFALEQAWFGVDNSWAEIIAHTNSFTLN